MLLNNLEEYRQRKLNPQTKGLIVMLHELSTVKHALLTPPDREALDNFLTTTNPNVCTRSEDPCWQSTTIDRLRTSRILCSTLRIDYLIKWVGHATPTWEASSTQGLHRMIVEYESKHGSITLPEYTRAQDAWQAWQAGHRKRKSPLSVPSTTTLPTTVRRRASNATAHSQGFIRLVTEFLKLNDALIPRIAKLPCNTWLVSAFANSNLTQSAAKHAPTPAFVLQQHRKRNTEASAAEGDGIREEGEYEIEQILCSDIVVDYLVKCEDRTEPIWYKSAPEIKLDDQELREYWRNGPIALGEYGRLMRTVPKCCLTTEFHSFQCTDVRNMITRLEKVYESRFAGSALSIFVDRIRGGSSWLYWAKGKTSPGDRHPTLSCITLNINGSDQVLLSDRNFAGPIKGYISDAQKKGKTKLAIPIRLSKTSINSLHANALFVDLTASPICIHLFEPHGSHPFDARHPPGFRGYYHSDPYYSEVRRLLSDYTVHTPESYQPAVFGQSCSGILGQPDRWCALWTHLFLVISFYTTPTHFVSMITTLHKRNVLFPWILYALSKSQTWRSELCEGKETLCIL